MTVLLTNTCCITRISVIVPFLFLFLIFVVVDISTKQSDVRNAELKKKKKKEEKACPWYLCLHLPQLLRFCVGAIAICGSCALMCSLLAISPSSSSSF